LQASGVVQYSWFPSTYLSCTNCPNPVATATQDITYVVTGTDANGCVSTANVRIFVDIKCGEEFFPTVFSPDKRGPDINETVCAYGNCIKEISYEIFNRWGQRVFKANSLTECWDGKINGTNAEPGVYAIKAQYILLNGTPKEYTGYLNLIR
jgi:gliding motility-associated-like protein